MPTAWYRVWFFALGALILGLPFASPLMSQPRYRTFTQAELASRKVMPGKVVGSNVCFTFRNTRLFPSAGIHAIFSSKVISIDNAGGFPNVHTDAKSKVVDFTGMTIGPGDSVTICGVFKNKLPGTEVNFWWWTSATGTRESATGVKLPSISDVQSYSQPSGGNVRDFVFKNIARPPDGVVLGLPTDEPGYGWVRYLRGDSKFFGSTGTARCLDNIETSSGKLLGFNGQVKNLSVKRHDNHLVGELLSLKLAIVANDYGITEPNDVSTDRLGDLLYSNADNTADTKNGLTIRQIVQIADSALTFCGRFDPPFYADLDSVISKINKAFDGSFEAITFSPFVLAGTKTLSEVPFLHANPSIKPVIRPKIDQSIVEAYPDGYQLRQNYPNPFNPTTTIAFTLPERSNVTIKVFNMLGQEVSTLLENEELESGAQTAEFNANGLTSGVYFYKITALGLEDGQQYYQAVRRMLLLK